MTGNQLVAYNLRQAREGLQLTQEEAARRLEPYLGKRWSVASFSDAERSSENGRTREFDANELLAFARAFGRSIAWFFTPPADVEVVYAGPPPDVTRAVRRDELEEVAALPTALDVRAHVADLRRIADELERAELASMRQAARATAAKPGGTVGVGRNEPWPDVKRKARAKRARKEE